MPKTGGTKSTLIGVCTIMDMFRRRRMMRRNRGPPLVTYKHQRNVAISYLGGNVNDIFDIYTGIPQGGITDPVSVPVGSRVESIFVSMNFVSESSATTGTYSWMILKLRTGQTVADISSTNTSTFSNIVASNLRNQEFATYMGIHATEDAGPIRYNIQIKIPKIYQRVREGDQLLLVFNADAGGPLNIGVRYKSKQ